MSALPYSCDDTFESITGVTFRDLRHCDSGVMTYPSCTSSNASWSLRPSFWVLRTVRGEAVD